MIAAVDTSSLFIWRIANIDDIPLKGAAVLTSPPVVIALPKHPDVHHLLRIASLDTHHIAAVSSSRNKSTSTVQYILEVWNINKSSQVYFFLLFN